MNNCGTCKYFGERYRQDNELYDDDEPPSIFHVCNFVKFNKQMSRTHEGLAFVVDGSGYFAAFCVKEDFGCNQWATGKLGPSTT